MISIRAAVFARALVAHIVGLIIIGLFGRLGTSGGFGNGAAIATLIGAIISLPWFVALSLAIWIWGATFDRHFLLFCFLGPLVVCGSWYALVGMEMLVIVAITAGTSSVVFLLMTIWNRWQQRCTVQL